MSLKRLLLALAAGSTAILLTLLGQPPALAYVEAPHSLGQIISLSSNVLIMRVEQVDRTKNLIVYRKVRDLKGQHPTELIRHNIAQNGFNPREWQYPIAWAEVGKTAILFHNGSASETCIGSYWYQCMAGGDWWTMSHGEPFMLRSYSGNVEKLAAAVEQIVAGKEVVVSCMVDGNKDDLHLRRAKIQRVRASLKLDYNPKRDFVGWGGEDFHRVLGMPGFTHYSALTRVDPDAQAISSADINGDGKADLCLAGSRVALLQNAGESLNEISLPGSASCRAAVWADYNADGKPDLLLATPTGPLLYTNLGNGFRDDTFLLPHEPAYNLTSAAWIDQDGDGRPDLLLGNGFHGLRLYRNRGPADPHAIPLRLAAWHYLGPFANAGGAGFDTVYPPEREVAYEKKYTGKDNRSIAWKEGKFPDGQVNNLALFDGNGNDQSVVYLHREIECARPMELPISLGSDDGLAVWLNGEKLLAINQSRGCTPDQDHVTLKLRPGKNSLLLKVTNGSGVWAFFFRVTANVPSTPTWVFEDVSTAVGLGPRGIGSTTKGDTLTVCDADGDGKPDFLYGAATGLLVRNTGTAFELVPDSGIHYRPGSVGPVFADYDRDGRPDLFVPQSTGCKLFHNEGHGRFRDVTTVAGLGSFTAQAACAAWGDVDKDGHLDLVVGCMRGPNRFFRNRGDGTFEDATEAIGLHQRVFNTQAIALVDLNGDGVLDMAFANEGQDSCVLLANPDRAVCKSGLTLRLRGPSAVAGSLVAVRDPAGKLLARHVVSGGDGRGGQASPTAHFALPPGKYRLELVAAGGQRGEKEIEIASTHSIVDAPLLAAR